jgi:hypothetical protein
MGKVVLCWNWKKEIFLLKEVPILRMAVMVPHRCFPYQRTAEGGRPGASYHSYIGLGKLPPEAVYYINAHGTGTPLAKKKRLRQSSVLSKHA